MTCEKHYYVILDVNYKLIDCLFDTRKTKSWSGVYLEIPNMLIKSKTVQKLTPWESSWTESFKVKLSKKLLWFVRIEIPVTTNYTPSNNCYHYLSAWHSSWWRCWVVTSTVNYFTLFFRVCVLFKVNSVYIRDGYIRDGAQAVTY